MNSLILCEGKTDCVLLQYYMEKVNGWKRQGESSFRLADKHWSNCFIKDNNMLTITETRGCSSLAEGFRLAIGRNENFPPGEDVNSFDRIIIFTDNDDENAENKLKNRIREQISDTSLVLESELMTSTWNKCEVTRAVGGKKQFELYIMFVPFDEYGALETYLLRCVAEKDSYDKEIIEKGSQFVDMVDPESRYLDKRRTITKAKFDVYFSVRTSAEQYGERQTILKSIPWENYDKIREDFKIFHELG